MENFTDVGHSKDKLKKKKSVVVEDEFGPTLGAEDKEKTGIEKVIERGHEKIKEFKTKHPKTAKFVEGFLKALAEEGEDKEKPYSGQGPREYP